MREILAPPIWLPTVRGELPTLRAPTFSGFGPPTPLGPRPSGSSLRAPSSSPSPETPPHGHPRRSPRRPPKRPGDLPGRDGAGPSGAGRVGRGVKGRRGGFEGEGFAKGGASLTRLKPPPSLREGHDQELILLQLQLLLLPLDLQRLGCEEGER